MQNESAPGARGPVFCGVDTHADSHWLYVLDWRGRKVLSRQFPADAAGYEALAGAIAAAGEPACVAMEGTSSWEAYRALMRPHEIRRPEDASGLVAARRAAKVSQVRAASILGTSEKYISMLERGQRELKPIRRAYEAWVEAGLPLDWDRQAFEAERKMDSKNTLPNRSVRTQRGSAARSAMRSLFACPRTFRREVPVPPPDSRWEF